MNQQRIEEFRRKLREGRPVRVVNGQVLLEPQATSPEQPIGSPTREAPQGVQVKPHEWGSEDPFYTTRSGEARALQEQALLAREYPGFMMDVDHDGTLYAHGVIGPTLLLRKGYHVLVPIPPGYGRGVMPQVHVIDPELRDGAPHMFEDHSLCLDHSGAFTRKSTLLTLLGWVTVWLVLYEGWVETGARW